MMIADLAFLHILTQLVMWIALILTVVSLVDYLIKNKNILAEQK